MNDYMNTVGRIFDIQKYSIHDGPGIRTIVFLKGCPLRCKWCCNPESQQFDIQNMTVNGENKVIGRDVTVAEVMDEVLKDSFYYRRSGGGVTLSGGECLMQPEFAVALLKACKQYGLDTAIETTGFIKYDIIKEYLPYVDHVLMDIKHIDEEKHKKFTGQSNRPILENALRIGMTAKELIIRVPVIPTFNNTHEEIARIADFARQIPNVKHLHLLPYHRLGQDKYAGLNRDYTLVNIEPMSDEYMENLLKTAQKSGLECQIGG